MSSLTWILRKQNTDSNLRPPGTGSLIRRSPRYAATDGWPGLMPNQGASRQSLQDRSDSFWRLGIKPLAKFMLASIPEATLSKYTFLKLLERHGRVKILDLVQTNEVAHRDANELLSILGLEPLPQSPAIPSWKMLEVKYQPLNPNKCNCTLKFLPYKSTSAHSTEI